jgi:hypothetical protein
MFGKRNVKFLGRAGILINYKEIEYVIDSEMLFDKKFGLVVFTDTLKRNDNSEITSEKLHEDILHFLTAYLTKRTRLKVHFRTTASRQ